MTERFVVDASIALAWVHAGQASSETAELLSKVEDGAEVVVPLLWFVETANALLVLERRKKITPGERQEALSRLGNLNVSADEESLRSAFTQTSSLAAHYGLSVYDACYLELASRSQLPLASKDSALRIAAQKAGVPLL